MLGLLKIHRNNRKSDLELRHRFLAWEISEYNYAQLLTLIEEERCVIEEELYSQIEKDELVNNHFRSIAGMIVVLYGVGLAAFIHNWIVN